MPSKHSPLVNVMISNCSINDSEKYDIWGRGKFAYDNTSDISHIDSVTINNCRFRGCNGENSASAIYLDVCKNIRINNNVAEDSVRFTWLSSCLNAVIEGNIGTTITYEGVFMSKTTIVDEDAKPNNRNIKINNNMFKDGGRNGIYAQFVNDCIITNNTVENFAQDDDTERNGILIPNTSVDVLVSNNIVRGDSHKYDISINALDNNIKARDNNVDSILYNSYDVLFIGDSITYGSGASDRLKTNYPSKISKNHDIGHMNIGVAGMRFYHPTESAKDIMTKIKTVTYLDKVKSISIFLGTNDWANNTAMGENVEDTTITTVFGAFNGLIAYIRSVNPVANITVFSPIYRSDKVESGGVTLEQFCNLLEECARYNNIKFVDMYHSSGISPYNAQVLLDDGLHPNDLGYEVLANRIYNELIR